MSEGSKRLGETEVAHDVLRTIRQIVRRISEHSKSLYREVGLTVPQLMCLKAIGELEEESEEVTVAMVAKRVQLSPATVSRIVDRLTRSNLVTRERRAKDRRKVCLSLTASGLERFQTLPVPLQEVFVRRLLELPQGERSTLLESLKRIAELMEAAEIDAAPMLTPEADVKVSEVET
ncbi:MAG: MarR family transcriptional regulator [Polyangiales bacterium]